MLHFYTYYYYSFPQQVVLLGAILITYKQAKSWRIHVCGTLKNQNEKLSDSSVLNSDIFFAPILLVALIVIKIENSMYNSVYRKQFISRTTLVKVQHNCILQFLISNPKLVHLP